MEFLFTGLWGKVDVWFGDMPSSRCLLEKQVADIKSAVDIQILSSQERPQSHVISTWLVFKYKGKWDEVTQGRSIHHEEGGLEVSPGLCQHLD